MYFVVWNMREAHVPHNKIHEASAAGASKRWSWQADRLLLFLCKLVLAFTTGAIPSPAVGRSDVAGAGGDRHRQKHARGVRQADARCVQATAARQAEETKGGLWPPETQQPAGGRRRQERHAT